MKQTKMIAGAAAVLLTLGLIGGGVAYYDRQQRIQKEAELRKQAEELNTTKWTFDNTIYLADRYFGFEHRMETFLFVGTDASGNEEGTLKETDKPRQTMDNYGTENGADDPYRGAMADFLLLMVLDHTDNTYGYIQIDRNTVTEVEELNEDGDMIEARDQQICTAHWYGLTPEMAAVNTETAVRKLLGELDHIDGYFVLNMADIGTLNHTVGGVEVTIEDDLTAADPAFKAGTTLTLTDEQAEAYIRARMNVGDGSNTARMDRQKQYMDHFFEKAREITKDRPNFANELWETLHTVGTTDMKGNDFSRISQMFLKGTGKGILRPEGETKIGQVLEDGIDHEEFFPDTKSLIEIMNQLFTLELVPEDQEPT